MTATEPFRPLRDLARAGDDRARETEAGRQRHRGHLGERVSCALGGCGGSTALAVARLLVVHRATSRWAGPGALLRRRGTCSSEETNAKSADRSTADKTDTDKLPAYSDSDDRARCERVGTGSAGLLGRDMIRKSLPQTKSATYSILAPSPDPAYQGMPVPTGTGFFIDPAGYFLTARHVVEGVKVEGTRLMQTPSPGNWGMQMVGSLELVAEWPEYDLALLKADFEKNSNSSHLIGRSGFPYVPAELQPQEDGTPVYAFGYPLPQAPAPIPIAGGAAFAGYVGLGPRTTSAIIASTLEHTRMVQTGAEAQVYVLDKALNYGNSGGPVVLTETGKALAVCARFQPVLIRQPAGAAVMIPSLYGVATSISNIASQLNQQLATDAL